MTEISRAIDLVSQAHNVAKTKELKDLLEQIEKLLVKAEGIEDEIDFGPLRYYKGKIECVIETKGTMNSVRIRFLEDGEGFKRGDRSVTSIRNCWYGKKRRKQK